MVGAASARLTLTAPNTGASSPMQSPYGKVFAGLGPAFPYLVVNDILAVLSLTLGSVAISWWIVTQGGAHDLAVFGISAAVTMLVALPLLSALGDRHAKSRLMAWGLLIAVIPAVALAMMASLGLYHIVPIIGIYAIDVTAFAVVVPAVSSIAADLVVPARLPQALGLQKSAQSLGRLVGPVLGGAVVATVSIQVALWIYTALLLLAAVTAFMIPPTLPNSAVRRQGWKSEVVAGLRAKWHIPIDRAWTIYAFFSMMFLGPAIGMLLPVKIHDLNLSATYLGATEAALGCGMLLGALWGAPRVIRYAGRFKASMGAVLLCALTILFMARNREPVVLMAGFALTGFAMSISQLVGQTHRLLAVPDHFRARFSSVNIMVLQMSAMIGPAIAGMALSLTDIGHVYLGFGGALLAVTLSFPLLPGIRRFLALEHHEVKGWYGKQHPHLFNPAPPPPASSCTDVPAR